MKRLVIALALAAAAAAHADTFTNCGLHVHVAAYHSEPGFNTATPGVGVICDTRFEDVRAGMGVFRNSIGRPSVYVGAAWQPLRLGSARIGVFGGAITGYRDYPLPMAAGLASLPLADKTVLHLTVLPSVKGLTPATVAFSIEHKF